MYLKSIPSDLGSACSCLLEVHFRYYTLPGTMSIEVDKPLVILIAHERADRLAQVTWAVTELGHQVIERTIGLVDVGRATIEARPDVAIVIVGPDSELRPCSRSTGS